MSETQFIDQNGLTRVFEHIRDDISTYSKTTSFEPITDAVNGHIAGLEVYGKSTQKTLSGKNLLKFDNSYNTNSNKWTYTSLESDNVKGTKVSGASYFLATYVAYLVKGQTYTVSCINTNISGVYLYTDKTWGTQIQSFKQNSTFVFSGETGDIVVGFYSVGDAVVEATLSNPQLELGSTATDFEPYCGGVPSPNPDYPQAIVDASNIVTTHTNNIFKGVYGCHSTSNGFVTNQNGAFGCDNAPIPCNSGDMYVLTIPETIWSGVIIWVGYYNADNSFINRVSISNGDVITIPSGVAKFFVSLYATNITATNYPKVQLEQDTTATPYVPYASTTIFLPQLRSVGDYRDSFIVKPDGSATYTKKLYEVVFDGSDDEGWGMEYGSGMFETPGNGTNLIPSSVYGEKCLCTHFAFNKVQSGMYNTLVDKEFGVQSLGHCARVFCKYLEKTSVDDWKTWLASNNITVCYPLAEPIVMELSPSQARYYRSLETFKDYTSFETDLEGNVTYIADSSIGNAVADISAKEYNDFAYLNEQKVDDTEDGINSAIKKLPYGWTGIPNDNTTFISEDTAGGDYGLRKFSALLTYVKNKFTNDSKISLNFSSGDVGITGNLRLVGRAKRKPIQGNLSAGATSLTLTDSSITANSIINVYQKIEGVASVPVHYKAISVSNGSVTITFDAQSEQITVGIIVDEFYS